MDGVQVGRGGRREMEIYKYMGIAIALWRTKSYGMSDGFQRVIILFIM